MTGRPGSPRPCPTCGVGTRSRNGYCNLHWRKSTSTPERPCLWCKARTTSPTRHCSTCERLFDQGANYVPDDSDALVGGGWIKRGGVMVWESDGTAPVPKREFAPSTAPWTHGTERAYQRHRRWRDNWPLPADDPCGCRAAHAAHEASRAAARERPEMKEAS